MRILKAYKFPVFILFLILIYSTIVGSQQLIKNAEQSKPQVSEPTTNTTANDSITAEIKEGEAKAEVKVNNESNVKSEQTSQGGNGTCKVTRNGVVSIVPADQVNVNEKSSGDITVKVECDNSSSSSTSNSSSKTTIKNNIDLNVSTSN